VRVACSVIAAVRDAYDDYKGQPPRDVDSYISWCELQPDPVRWMREHLDLEGVVTGPQLHQRGFSAGTLAELGLVDANGAIRDFPDEPLRTATVETSAGLLVCLVWKRLYVNAHDPSAGVFIG